MSDFVSSTPTEGGVSERAQLSEPALYLRRSDYLWISSFFIVALINIWFGIHNYNEAHKIVDTKANAQRLIQWLADKGTLREQGQEVLAGCNDPTNLWQDCLAAMTAAGGPFGSFRNTLEPKGRVVSESCDRSDLRTLGSIVIERGTPKPSDSSALVYTKMPTSQTLSGKLPLKVYICGRSFHPMNVGEAIF